MALAGKLPELAVEITELDRFGDVGTGNILVSFQICDRAADLDHTVISAGGKPKPLLCKPQEIRCSFVQPTDLFHEGRR